MDTLLIIDLIPALAGLALTVVICVSPRFGQGSRFLSLFLVLGSVSSVLILAGPMFGWTTEWSAFLAFSCLVLCAAAGCLSIYKIKRKDYISRSKPKRLYLGALTIVVPSLIVILYVNEALKGLTTAGGMVALGQYGYYAATYMILVSVIAIGNVEQALRSAEEHVRWEIKFLLLGIASIFGAIVYVASTVLMYSPEYAFLSPALLRIFPIIFLCGCFLIFESWRRSTAGSLIVVSQGVIYSTITLVSVGFYLIVTALVARWVSQWESSGIPAEPVIFILSLIALSVILLGTAFRHRTRRWIRRNVFAGRYDYRQFWMDATQRVRSIDSSEVAAAALAELIEKALGSHDISVWSRNRGSDSMRLIASRGAISSQLPAQISDLAVKLRGLTEPVSIAGATSDALKEVPADLLQQSKASILVPLVSSGRLIGLMTVGADRSGRPFDWETGEFLRVMAVHFANEMHKTELLSTLVEAREAEAFRTFSTFLLHDLKNFATTLSLIARNAGRHQGNPDFHRDAFQSVFDISEKMRRLCNSLRTFSHSLAANKTLEDVNNIVRLVAGTLEASLGRQLELELADVPEIMVDRDEMIRVLHNIVLNAHEASPPGAVIKLSSARESRGVAVSVADHGAGIPKDFREQAMFHPFQTTKPDGLGIGLFQSKKIVEAHGGVIEVESREGEGTIVRVIVPAEPAPVQPGAAAPDTTVAAVR